MARFSILDLAPVVEGGDAALALRHSADLAAHAERWGYHRFWLAEHHNMPGIASSATAVAICHVAAATAQMRIGSGGIMLPNHAPLVIAEQFGTLASLFPGRIDLGVGRAPGTDRRTARALRRHLGGTDDTFPQDLEELRSYFTAPEERPRVQAVPGHGIDVPIYLLGSSDFSARLAAQLGLPFAFASHFAPAYLEQAVALYRRDFNPSASCARPYVIVGAGVYAAGTDAEARHLATSAQQQALGLVRGRPRRLPPPVPVSQMNDLWNPAEAAMIAERMRYAAVGSPETVRARLGELLALTAADEIMLISQIYDHQARLRSFEIAADVLKALKSENADGRDEAVMSTDAGRSELS